MLFVAAIIYLFLLVFIESELVKVEVRQENLKNEVVVLRNQRKQLESDLIDVANLASIEEAARMMDYVFPEQNDILGVVE
jgi:hypothetical protein